MPGRGNKCQRHETNSVEVGLQSFCLVRYVNGGNKENGFQPKPILHHSTPNLSAKIDPGAELDLRAQQEITRTPPSLPGTAPELQRSPLSSRSEEHLSLKSVTSQSNPSISVNQGNSTPIPSSPRRSVHSSSSSEDQEEEINGVLQSEDSTETIQVLDSTVPNEKTEADEEEDKDETVVAEANRPDSEASSESSQETQTSDPTSQPPIIKPLNQQSRKKRPFVGRPEVKLEHKLYPDSLPPYSQPKEALARTLLQLDNPEWEVIIQGLEGLVRLARHHPKLLSGHTHQTAIHITRHIRALRSQVARAACQASQQLFTSLGRSMDQEIDELTGALLSRMADTNRFLRADSSLALDTLVDHSGPVKAIHALVNRGSRHQNAIVRGATCRLLLRICTRLGTERTMALPKDTRDSILITGAKCLAEGSLDTRRYAKEMFTLLSSDTRLRTIMSEVVPNNIMRNISKAMARIPLS